MARILGLDIEQDALVGAVVRVSFRNTEVERYLRIPIDARPGTEGYPLALADARQRLSRAIQAPPNSVICAFDGKHVSLRNVTLPAAAVKRAAEVLVFELESMLPFDTDEAVIDHQIVSSDPQQSHLLVAATPERNVEDALSRLSDMGLDPRELCPAPVYLENLAVQLQLPGNVLMVELREGASEVALLSSGKCLTGRTIGAMPTQPGARDAFLQSLAMTVSSFRAGGHPAAEELLLVGPLAQTAGIEEELSARFHIPTRVPDLPRAATGDEPGPGYARALGLAVRGARPGKHINLRRGRFSPSQAQGQWSSYANLAVTCLVAVLVAVMFSLKARQSLLLDEQATLRSQLGETTKAVFGKPASTLASAEKLLKNPGGSDPLPRFDAYDALGVISGAIDADITHEVRRLRIEVGDDKHEGHLELQGTVSSIEQRDAIASALEKHPCFVDIEKGKTTSARGEGDIDYQLEAKVQCPGAVSSTSKSRKAR